MSLTGKYGSAGKANFYQKPDSRKIFGAFELMMAPYAIGHMKMSFLPPKNSGYRLSDNERSALHLTNTLEMEELQQISIPGLSSLSEESYLAGKSKEKEEPILMILGNPSYSGHSGKSKMIGPKNF